MRIVKLGEIDILVRNEPEVVFLDDEPREFSVGYNATRTADLVNTKG